MRTFDLNGLWDLRYGPQVVSSSAMESPAVPATFKGLKANVPGNVELDLMAGGELPTDLVKGEAIYQLRALEKHQWWYSKRFDLSGWQPATGATLVFEGVDTLATVWLNGVRLARLENMLIPHRLDVSGVLRRADNELVVGIDSPVLAAMDERHPPGERAFDANWESLNIRKAAHSFGWDIMPRAVSAGLWRPVRIEFPEAIRIENVYVATESVERDKGAARLWINWDVTAPPHEDLDTWTMLLTVMDVESGRSVHEQEIPILNRHACVRTRVEGVKFWWPRGAGAQTLYTVRLSLRDGAGDERAICALQTGFRTIRLERSELLDEAGNGRFAFIVNGEEIFMKGTNWVPLDAFHSRDTERMQETLDMLVDLNCNMVRCWGGSVYEPPAFFEFCDREGILVWQDFALACYLYPQTEAFYRKMRAEAETIVPMLRNHPSLALWAGNNEVDLFYHVLLPHIDPNEADVTSRQVLATVCRQYDPWREYLPSSPYFSPELHAIGNPSERRPEDHLWWGPRDDFKGTYYKDSKTVFVSETGFQGVPCVRSLKKMFTGNGLWPPEGNEEWLAHGVRPQKRGFQFSWRVGLIAPSLEFFLGEQPDNLDDFVFAAQLVQAEAKKYFVERWRMRKGRCSGILWWNLRDGWPIVCGGVVDYYGEKSLAYRALKRVQTDICVMLDEAEDGSHSIVVTNDTLAEAEVRVKITLESESVFAGTFGLGANTREALGTVPALGRPGIYELEWTVAGASSQNHYFAGNPPYNLADCRRWYGQLGLG